MLLRIMHQRRCDVACRLSVSREILHSFSLQNQGSSHLNHSFLAVLGMSEAESLHTYKCALCNDETFPVRKEVHQNNFHIMEYIVSFPNGTKETVKRDAVTRGKCSSSAMEAAVVLIL